MIAPRIVLINICKEERKYSSFTVQVGTVPM